MFEEIGVNEVIIIIIYAEGVSLHIQYAWGRGFLNWILKDYGPTCEVDIYTHTNVPHISAHSNWPPCSLLCPAYTIV